jgi:two-component system chemotaxis sensor kinase CheA
MEKAGVNRKSASFKFANITAFLGIVVLGFFRIAQSGQDKIDVLSMGFMGFLCIIVPLGLMVTTFAVVKNYKNLAFIVPLIFFAGVTGIQVMTSTPQTPAIWDLFYLPVCITACILSCLYDNFKQTIVYNVFQNILLGIMTLNRVPFLGQDSEKLVMNLFGEDYEGVSVLTVGWGVSLVASLFIIATFYSLKQKADSAIKSRDSFKTLMSTTPNYIAMVDRQNRVVYISNNLAKLGHITNSEWVIGRPVLDLFPTVELKELAGALLRKTSNTYEEMWEYTLNGERGYFKAMGNDLPGDIGGTLINLMDMTHLAERDEIAAMKDSLNIGIFFMNKEYIIQDNHSKALFKIMGVNDFHGIKFTELLEKSVTSSELQAICDYFEMVFLQQFDQDMLKDINPLNEFQYVSPETRERKIFHMEFITVDRGHGEIMLMISIYDITAGVELKKRLAEEKKHQEEEMRTMFELINVESSVFNDFIGDANYEFGQIDRCLKNDRLTPHEKLVEIYQSVHAVKSNAVILGLATFGEKVHGLETIIKNMREKENVTFDDMLHLTLQIESIAKEKEGFKDTISKIDSMRTGGVQKTNDDVLIESLVQATNRASRDLNKNVKFVTESMDRGVIVHGPRRLMKEILMQLVRNSVVHGIETREERLAKGKDETGSICLSIKVENSMIHIKLRDDGGGINFEKIKRKGLESGLFKSESEASNKNVLLNAIFSPGFSTAEAETVHGGRGIGLNLVRDRVKEIGGNLKVQTEPNKGTAFHIYIPLPPEVFQAQAADKKKVS